MFICHADYKMADHIFTLLQDKFGDVAIYRPIINRQADCPMGLVYRSITTSSPNNDEYQVGALFGTMVYYWQNDDGVMIYKYQHYKKFVAECHLYFTIPVNFVNDLIARKRLVAIALRTEQRDGYIHPRHHYDINYNNSEHFATMIFFGVGYSTRQDLEVEKWGSRVLLMVGMVAASVLTAVASSHYIKRWISKKVK